ncbi:DUF2339 domain-containing protein [Massilia sp. W12]|uniref:DUF2339 domain-containing protein n=1 Tax=Massilia sp. W12 TaxID=3126507 RepID=UPI0030D11F4F
MDGILILLALAYFLFPVFCLILFISMRQRFKQLETKQAQDVHAIVQELDKLHSSLQALPEQAEHQAAISAHIAQLQQRISLLEQGRRQGQTAQAASAPEDKNVWQAPASAPGAPAQSLQELELNLALPPAASALADDSTPATASSTAPATPASALQISADLDMLTPAPSLPAAEAAAPDAAESAFLREPAQESAAAHATETTAASATSGDDTPDTAAERAANSAAAPPAAPAMPAWLQTARDWLFGGNLVAKIGLLILFFGMAFLLKYASEQFETPIELRLAGMAAGAIGLLLWAWRIRDSRRNISLPTQGAALAMLMLITFGALRFYHVIPPGLAFFLLFALTAFTCILAVLQNALWLALFGISGGFLTPVLTSSGGGNHIALFSYYLLLNAGILAIALKRSWRSLNLVGLFFTFTISTAWGVLRYSPEHYLSTQGFLLVFFLFYVALALLYAERQPPKLKGLIDATLLFGTPMLAFGLQAGLVRDKPFGLALSALTLGLFYAGLSMLLWRRKQALPGWRLMLEALLALAVVFGTLAIPFALDARWTSAAWALEGATIVWVSLRQQRPLGWGFGLLVQAGAWLAFMYRLADVTLRQEHNVWLGFLLLALAGFAIAHQFRRQPATGPKQPPGVFALFAAIFLCISAAWLLAGAWLELFLRAHGADLALGLVLSALAVAALLFWLATSYVWMLARTLACTIVLLASLTLGMVWLNMPGFVWADQGGGLWQGPFLSSLLLALGALASAWFLQQAGQGRWQALLLAVAGIWWFGPALTDLARASGSLAAWLNVRPDDVQAACWCILAAGTGALAQQQAHRRCWPDLRHAAWPAWLVQALLSLAAGVMLLDGEMLPWLGWLSMLTLWLHGEYSLRLLQAGALPPARAALLGQSLLHLLRSVAPLLLAVVLCRYWLQALLLPPASLQTLLDYANWRVDQIWILALSLGLGLALLWQLLLRAEQQRWPAAPRSMLYLQIVLPAALAGGALLLLFWHLTQDGGMRPLPYLPLANPLDLLTLGWAMLAWRLSQTYAQHDWPGQQRLARLVPAPRRHLLLHGALFLWCNLTLMKTIAHMQGIAWDVDLLFASQTVQVGLSLLWSTYALGLMLYGARRRIRLDWSLGAVLLGLVVAKLFLVDLSQAGSIARIISFVGVGLLMLTIAYLAPWPGQAEKT